MQLFTRISDNCHVTMEIYLLCKRHLKPILRNLERMTTLVRKRQTLVSSPMHPQNFLWIRVSAGRVAPLASEEDISRICHQTYNEDYDIDSYKEVSMFL